MNAGPLVILPFHGNAHLAEHQKHHLLAVAGELASLDCAVLLVDASPGSASPGSASPDSASPGSASPDSARLRARLAELREGLSASGIPSDLVTHPGARGLAATVNGGLDRARAERRPALLLDAGAGLTPGGLSEMTAVMAHDEKFGFVGPRSNDAGLATLPWYLVDGDDDSAQTEADARRIMPLLERWHVVPTVSPFCMLIRSSVLELAGLLGEDLPAGGCEAGGCEAGDLVMRANGLGFVAVLANHAWAMHVRPPTSPDSSSPTAPEGGLPCRTLGDRYPELAPALRRYASGEEQAFERMAAAALLTRRHPSVLVDLSFMRPTYNGTFEQAKFLLDAMVQSEAWNASLITSYLGDPETLAFHGLQGVLDRYEHVELPDAGGLASETFAVRLALAQPFSWEDTRTLWPSAAFHIVSFLDNITTDCAYIELDNPAARSLWRFVAQHAAAMAFLSTYARDNFTARFPRRHGIHDAVIPLSLDPGEYRFATVAGDEQLPCRKPFVLVVGNRYRHKRVDETADLLARRLARSHVVALGYQGRPPRNVHAVESGLLAEEDMAALYAAARLVVFPSSYEGFGIPILRGLGNGARVVALDTAVSREIRERLAGTGWENRLTLAAMPDELVDLAVAISERETALGDVPVAGGPVSWRWADAIEAFRRVIVEVCGDTSELERSRDAVRALGYLAGAADLAELNRLRRAGAELDDLRQEVVALDAIRRENEELKTSTSWKATAPMRQASQMLRRARRSLSRRP